MATTNPRVAAYLLPKNFERLKAFSKGRGLSVSQAVDTILSEYFGGELSGNTLQTEARLVALEASLGRVDSLSQEVVVVKEAIASLLADVTRLNSVLVSDTSIAPEPLPQPSRSELLSSTDFSSTASFVPEFSSVGELLSNTSIAPDFLNQPSQSELLNSTLSPALEPPTKPRESVLPRDTLFSSATFPEPLANPIVSELLSSTDNSQTALDSRLLSDTLDSSTEVSSADSAEISESKAATNSLPSSLPEDENSQLYQQAIKRAKELKKKRLTQAQIADTLNTEGFTTITGKTWTRAAISRLFN